MNSFPLLTTILLCPLTALVAILILPRERENLIRWVALTASAATVVLSIAVMMKLDTSSGRIQFEEKIPWVPSLGIHYSMGVDGMSATLVLLTAIVIFTGVISSWVIMFRVKEFFANMMFLVLGVFGVFMTTNLFFFFLFYEVAVIPMYLLIITWGSTNKEYAAMKLTLYLLFGSAFIITGFLALYALPGSGTFDLFELKEKLTFSRSFQLIWFPILFFGFGVLAGCFPFHVWSPDGHVAAPTAASMLHAGVLMKLGAYGILRIGVFLFPEGARAWAPVMAVLALCNIVYGAMVASQQRDLKFIIGYSSVSHMGIVILGIATLSEMGLNGAIFQMFSHGIMTALFFACVGFIYDNYHTRMIDELGGLSRQAPLISSLFIIGGLVGLGLPGFSGFVAEFMVTVGAIHTYPLIGILSILGLVITAYYVLTAVQKAFYGVPNPKLRGVPDLGPWQLFPRGLLVAVLVLFGIFPGIFLGWIERTTLTLIPT